jgi:ribosome-binding factor A
MESRRHQRVRELLTRVIGEVIRKEFPIHEVGLVTVHDVGLSSDLRSAKVFISILGDEAQQKKGLTVLQKERKHLQSIVGHSVILKYTPLLDFVIDDSVQRGNRVLGILDELERAPVIE